MAGLCQTNYFQRLTINAIWILFLFKAYFFFSVPPPENVLYAVSFLQDIFLIILTWFLFAWCFGKIRQLRTFGNALFVIFFVAAVTSSFIYTFFLQDIMQFPVNIFGVSTEIAGFFTENFLGGGHILRIAGLILIIFLISLFFPLTIRRRKLISAIAIALALLFIPTLFRPAVNPMIYSVQDQILLWTSASEKISLLPSPVPDSTKANEYSFLDKSSIDTPLLQFKYKRILVLVMESINYRHFMNDSEKNPESFLIRFRKNIAAYDNYYSLNLDSYTSLIAMLNSIFVPYQAYVREDEFSFVNRRNNLISILNSNGFTTAFLTSYGRQQQRFVPDTGDWSVKIYCENVENNPGFSCITSNKIEYACEDLAVYDDLMLLITTHEKIFVFQEMVYGHMAGWRDMTGIDALTYYNRYFNKVMNDLLNKNLADSTLLIVVSDHGPRDNVYNIENYHVPMLVYAKDIPEGKISAFLSHLDFKDILLERATGQHFVASSNTIFTLGNSGEWVYGKISDGSSHLFINNRMRTIRGNLPEEHAIKLNKEFSEYMNYFEYLKQAN